MRRVLPLILIALGIGGAIATFRQSLVPPRRAGGSPAHVRLSPALLRTTYLARLDSLDRALRALAVLPPPG